MQLAVCNILGRGNNGIGEVGIKSTNVAVGGSCSVFDVRESFNELWKLRDAI